MKKIRVLVTAVGTPGAATFLRMLKNNTEREVELVGIDMDHEAVGRFMVESFYTVPPGDSEQYIPALRDVVIQKRPDVLFVVSSNEVYHVACHKEEFEKLGTRVIVSDAEPILLAENKYLMY